MNSHTMLSLHPGGISLTIRTAERAGITAGDRVLDVGCGTGAGLAALRERLGIDAYGCDISERILTIARDSHPDISFECCDAASLPYHDGSFDAVMMECVLTLLDDPASALREAARVLKPGGIFIISTLVNNGMADPAALICLMTDLGFDLLSFEDHKKELTDYMIETIMEYGSLEERIAAETAATGASVFDCGCGCINARTLKKISYSSFIFQKQ